MKNKLSKFALSSLGFTIMFFLAIVTFGYTNPTISPPANNNEVVPILCDSSDCQQTTGAGTSSVKNGGLSVNTFQARGDAHLAQDAFMQDLIRAGVATDTVPRTIYFGSDSSTEVSVEQTGALTVDGVIQSDTLVSSANDPICADATGTFYLCPK